MRTLHVWHEEHRTAPGALRRTLVLEPTEGGRALPRRHIHFDIASDVPVPAVETLDHAAVALVQSAMHHQSDLMLHGPVCATLLDNLDEFQAAWSCWLPQTYRRIAIGVERETVWEPSGAPPRAIAAFSGGVDSAFTVWRHHFRQIGQRHHDLAAAVFVHGFDIPLSDPDSFRTAETGARAMLDGLGLGLRIIRTNLRDALPDWENTHATGLAACLHQFTAEAGIGLIAGDEPYSALVFPWGSNPVSNPLLSSEALALHYDSGGYTRSQKVAHLATWPAARDHLRVCWRTGARGGNCGRCEKCVRTLLNFRLAGLRHPACFPKDISDDDIRAIRLDSTPQINLLQDVLSTAQAQGLHDSWVDAVAQVLARYA